MDLSFALHHHAGARAPVPAEEQARLERLVMRHGRPTRAFGGVLAAGSFSPRVARSIAVEHPDGIGPAPAEDMKMPFTFAF